MAGFFDFTNPIPVFPYGITAELLLDYYTEYAAQATQAAQLASALSNPAGAKTTPYLDVQPQGPRKIALQWNVSNAIAGAMPPQLFGSASVGTPPAPPAPPVIANVSTAHKMTFDVALSSGITGMAQKIIYTNSARQNIKQTAVGFHIDEFGLAAGRLDFDAIVIFQGNQAGQLNAIFNFFQKQKMTQPLDPSQPGIILKYADSYMGRSFVISQENIQFQANADEQNRGRLTFSAAILKDYSIPNGTTPAPNSTAAQLQAMQAAAAASITSLQNFLTGS